jgi:hypothetical protein
MTEVGVDREVLVVERGDLEEVARVAREQGVQVQTLEEQGFEPISTVTLLLLGSSLAIATVSMALEQAHGGQVFDLRPGEARRAYRTRDVMYGLVVIYAVDGTIDVQVKEVKGAFGQVVEAIQAVVTELGKASLAGAKDAVQRAVGDKGTVTATQAA